MLGEKIAERRKQMSLTQKELADAIAVKQPFIAAFENGTKKDCNLSTARRLARALGCSIDYLAATWDTAEDPAPAPALPPGPRRRGRPRKPQLATAEAQP